MPQVELLDFYADWCGPCQQMKPVIEELEKELSDVKFTKINIDENHAQAQQYNVMSIPTFIITKNGKITDQLTGAQSKQALSDKLK